MILGKDLMSFLGLRPDKTVFSTVFCKKLSSCEPANVINERRPSGDSRKAVYFIAAKSLDRPIFAYTFHMIDWIEWHPVFHNYDFLHFLRTIKAWNML